MGNVDFQYVSGAVATGIAFAIVILAIAFAFNVQARENTKRLELIQNNTVEQCVYICAKLVTGQQTPCMNACISVYGESAVAMRQGYSSETVVGGNYG